jgi:hypothetical protein
VHFGALKDTLSLLFLKALTLAVMKFSEKTSAWESGILASSSLHPVLIGCSID